MSAAESVSIGSESACIVGPPAYGSGQPAGPASSLDDDPPRTTITEFPPRETSTPREDSRELTTTWTVNGTTVDVSGDVRCVESISGPPSDRFLFVIDEPSSGFYLLSTTNI